MRTKLNRGISSSSGGRCAPRADRIPAGLILWFAWILLGTISLNGQATNIQIVTTSTQAVISYSAPDTAACTVEVREGDAQGPLVPDVDPSIFAGANMDSRSVNVASGQHRTFVVGKRAAETGLDGFRYSRALQIDTAHAYKITCGSQTVVGQFKTMNAPLGASYNDPLPADPLKPGEYAWPDFRWNDRNHWVVDPYTGFRVKQLDSPRDAIEYVGSESFVAGSNVAPNSDWSNPNGFVDGSAPATYSGSNQGFLFAELGSVYPVFSAHSVQSSSPNAFVPTFTAYCSSADCAAAGDADRTIQFCLTIDGANCASDMLEAVLKPCLSNCSGSDFTFPAMVNPTPILADWFRSNNGIPTIDMTDFAKRSGTVKRTGAIVTLNSGDRFDLKWKAGAGIRIGGTAYTISSVDHDAQLTLSGSPAGGDASAQYVASNAGILVRKKTASLQQVAIKSIGYRFETGQPTSAESAGDEDVQNSCSPIATAGPNGEPGYHCVLSGSLYWIGQDTGTVNRLGRAFVFYNGGDPNGWNGQACAGTAWDWRDGNSFYCPNNDLQGHTIVFKWTYNGSNLDTGDYGADQRVKRCLNGNTPCWDVVNFTAATDPIDVQVAAFHPDWARFKFHTNSVRLFGRMAETNSLLFLVRRDQNTDTMAFLFRFDLNTARIVGGISTWAYAPSRWAVMHGPEDLNDPKWVHVASTYFRGPLTGTDRVAGNGPYYSTITNTGGIDANNHPCPARPPASTIPVADWPTGNVCITLRVDGEPGDPTPAQYTDGTIDVSGINLTGRGTNWTNYLDGTQIVIGGQFYTFNYVAADRATLDRPAGDATGASYKIYREPVNNPKVGNPLFAYLQDAEPGDIFCATQNGTACIPAYFSNEFMRLLMKDPLDSNTWTLHRGYKGKLPQSNLFSLGQNGWLIAQPGSCSYTQTDFCPEASLNWNALDDPYGYNRDGTTVRVDPSDAGCCHSARQNGAIVDIGLACPNHPGQSPTSGCYFARFNSRPAVFSDSGYTVSLNPIFHNLVGVGVPNEVETHPSHAQSSPPATANELRWMADARPYFGDPGVLDAGTLIGGTLYKFTASQVHKLHPRTLPTMASCGAKPLVDVSGGAIAQGPADNFKYCLALADGDCQNGSASGDLYVNCPQVRFPSCVSQGVGQSNPDTQDICVSDMGAHAINITQIAVDKPDPDGNFSRRVTAAFSRYSWIFPFWNAKAMPNGRWMLVWSTYFQGLRNSLLLVKLPPFPAETDGLVRNDFMPYLVKIATPQVPGASVTNAVVQFGYDKRFFCTSRQETCIQGSAADFAYRRENPAGVPCANGCTIPVPAISQRVLYFQVLLRDAGNNVVAKMEPEAVAIQ